MSTVSKEWIKFIQSTLESFFPLPKTTLSATGGPYTMLISVLLSARCRDVQVNKVTPKLFELASTPEAMMRIPVDKIRAIIRPCGLSDAKAKAIYNLSCQLVENCDGKVPDNFEDLESLPGVGHKTASVVLGRAFGIPTFPVDTHIHRLAKRWHLVTGNTPAHTEKCLKAIFPQSSWHALHLQMIHYGRQFCNRHACTDKHLCPICSSKNRYFGSFSTPSSLSAVTR